MSEPINYQPWREPTRLIAAAIYTRGLWTSLFLWRALSVRPFKSRAVEWGIGTLKRGCETAARRPAGN